MFSDDVGEMCSGKDALRVKEWKMCVEIFSL
jgi:hypothetical protein